VSPSLGSMLGGENILVAGPCFKPQDNIICEFDGKERTKGTYINAIRAFCAVPMATKTGRVPLLVSIDNGVTFAFHGKFTYGKTWYFLVNTEIYTLFALPDKLLLTCSGSHSSRSNLAQSHWCISTAVSSPNVSQREAQGVVGRGSLRCMSMTNHIGFVLALMQRLGYISRWHRKL
jgi:hypothetical protein